MLAKYEIKHNRPLTGARKGAATQGGCRTMGCSEAGSLAPKEPTLLRLEAGHERDPAQPG